LSGPSRTSIAREIGALRQSLRTFDRTLRRLAPRLSAAMGDGAVSKAAPAQPRPRLTAKARASMVLQGRYMGFMRQLQQPRQKAEVRKIREVRGVRAAIERARQMARI
jgi:hypothetical protein